MVMNNIERRIANTAGGGRATMIGDRIRYLEKSGVYMAPFGMRGGEAFFVDPTNGNNKRNGDSWDKSLKTVAQAVSLASSHDTIFVRGWLTESLVTPNWNDGPNFITLIGCSGGTPGFGTGWGSEAAGEPCIDLNAAAWDISNFRFTPPAGEAAVKMHYQGTGDTVNDLALQTRVHNNTFIGGLYGIDFYGAPNECQILDNIFSFITQTASAAAIKGSNTSFAIAYRALIQGNLFHENENHVVCPLNSSFVLNNVFQEVGVGVTAEKKLDIGAGSARANMVHGNYFGGDYSIVGGYNPGTNDSWAGNFSMDTGEAEVGDNGITVLAPT